ncbi:MAG: ATP-grasp domain-containing protein [Muribaculaceae bacterium]|nr:ATP-grasp domain-containing protein [Muribaculaceae bacterium]
MEKVGILFLGGAKRVSMAEKFISAGQRLGVEVVIYSYELSREVPVAAVAGILTGLKWGDPGIYEDLHAKVISHGISLMVPFVDGAVEVAARYRDLYGGVTVPAGDAASAARMFDKVEADRLFREKGLPVPSSDGFPLIAKPRFGSASKGIKIIADETEFRPFAGNPDYLLQEYISPRREITVDCYVSLAGEIIAAVPRYRLETQGGEASVTETFRDREVEELARKTLRLTGLRGAVTIQMLRDTRDNRLMLMEINPRLGGGAVCACHAGADLPGFILRDTLGLPVEPFDGWKSHIRICRYMSEVAFDMSASSNDN